MAFSVAPGATLCGALVAVFFALPPAVEDAFALSPRSTINIPNYVFDHEDNGVSAWKIEIPKASRASFAYLVGEPQRDGREHRSLILVDDLEHPKSAWFLTGQKLSPVPAIKGKPLSERIDRQLSQDAKYLDSSGTVTVNVPEREGPKEQIKFQFTRALYGFDEKFQHAPCLTLPAVLTLSRGAQTVEFAVLLKNEKRSDGFDPKCGPDAGDLLPPAYSYVSGSRLHFAFSSSRFVFRHLNYVVSIPYDLSEQTIRSSALLIGKAQLGKILTDFEFPKSPPAGGKTLNDETRQEAFAIQQSIDSAIARLKANGERQ